MKTIFRQEKTEEGLHNIILTNRCGNRLTLLCHADHIELEAVYKPNAFRRKDYAARNFSNRDLYTLLFPLFSLPRLHAADLRAFDYDPFVTRITMQTEEGVRNLLTFINLPDENCFALAAEAPLTLAFRPHTAFTAADGLLCEHFTDRGEEDVSFVSFTGYTANRYRVLEDGTHILQLFGEETVLFGGEENLRQVQRVVRQYGGRTAAALADAVEERIRPALGRARLHLSDPDAQRVLDLNRRLLLSMVDGGGVTFGALNRAYFLSWYRDTLMSTGMAALAGDPSLLRLTCPYCLENPSVRKNVDGREIREYLQIVGTRWTKSEDDGLFYVVYGLYQLYQTTGDDEYLQARYLTPLADAMDYAHATLYDEEEGLFGSDTLGETTLSASPLFGYDPVDGSVEIGRAPVFRCGNKHIARSYSLYHNTNIYNALRMLEVLLQSGPEPDPARAARYRNLADMLRLGIRRRFIGPDGLYRAEYLVLEDGERSFSGPMAVDANPWECTWALSIGPFLPDIAASVRSGRFIREEWGRTGAYGLCPWNTLSRLLAEYGLTDAEYRAMLATEFADALAYTPRFPMTGASTEYAGNPGAYRGLPFTAGSLMLSLAGRLLQALPMGLAVREGGCTERIEDFHYHTSRLTVTAEGDGRGVASWSINGEEVHGTLQIPEELLRHGRNVVEVRRGSHTAPRLYASTARLLRARTEYDRTTYLFDCPTVCELVFEGFDRLADPAAFEAGGVRLPVTATPVDGTDMTLVTVETAGPGMVVFTG